MRLWSRLYETETKLREMQRSRDEWRILAEGWAQMCDELQGERNKLDQKVGQYESGARTEKEYQAVVKECDDLQTVLRYGSNEYKRERDKERETSRWLAELLAECLVRLVNLKQPVKRLVSLYERGYDLPPYIHHGEVEHPHSLWRELREALK